MYGRVLHDRQNRLHRVEETHGRDGLLVARRSGQGRECGGTGLGAQLSGTAGDVA